MNLENLKVQELSVQEQESIEAGGCGCGCFSDRGPRQGDVIDTIHWLYHEWTCS